MPTTDELKLKRIPDNDWVSSLFMVGPTDGWCKADEEMRYQTSADLAIGGSGLGNSRVINPPIGISEYCDIPRGYGMTGKQGTGTGVAYNELIDANLDVLTIRPGVPRFNALSVFWKNAFNTEAMAATEYGWFTKTLRLFGNVIGFLASSMLKLVALPYKLIRSFILGDNKNRFAYYYLSPAPLLFWSGLDTMVNDVAIKLGITGDVRFSEEPDDGSRTGKSLSVDEMHGMLEYMPGVLNEIFIGNNVRIDTMSISFRYDVMHRAREAILKRRSREILGKKFTNPGMYGGAVREWREVVYNTTPITAVEAEKTIGGIRDKLKQMGQAQDNRHDEVFGTKAKSAGLGADFEDKNFIDDFSAISAGGADFFNIAVDKVSDGTSSISTGTGASAIESSFNSVVSNARSTWFNVAGGNVDDGMIGDITNAAVTGAGAFTSGVLGSFLGGAPTAAVGGKAFLDIPNVPQETTTTFNNTSYTISSRSSSGHPMAKLKMLFPYLALLRLASPMSAGPRAFSSPFLVEAHHRGRSYVGLGVISDLSCNWGGSAGWDFNAIPNALKMSFTITNLSKNFHIPLDPSYTNMYEDQSEFSAHMSVMTGESLTDIDKSFSYNLRTSWARKLNNIDRFFSVSQWAMWSGVGTRNIIGGPMSLFGHYVERN